MACNAIYFNFAFMIGTGTLLTCNYRFSSHVIDSTDFSYKINAGNKKITLIYNLETYRIPPAEFAHKCQVLVTSVPEPEPHLLVGARAGSGAVTRCGSGSDNAIKHC
jgi:hypothetical protein